MFLSNPKPSNAGTWGQGPDHSRSVSIVIWGKRVLYTHTHLTVNGTRPPPSRARGNGAKPIHVHARLAGFAVADVDYGGSTGYGTAYRNRLQGRWGLVDVQDCAAAAEVGGYLVGWVPGLRVRHRIR